MINQIQTHLFQSRLFYIACFNFFFLLGNTVIKGCQTLFTIFFHSFYFFKIIFHLIKFIFQFLALHNMKQSSLNHKPPFTLPLSIPNSVSGLLHLTSSELHFFPHFLDLVYREDYRIHSALFELYLLVILFPKYRQVYVTNIKIST